LHPLVTIKNACLRSRYPITEYLLVCRSLPSIRSTRYIMFITKFWRTSTGLHGVTSQKTLQTPSWEHQTKEAEIYIKFPSTYVRSFNRAEEIPQQKWSLKKTVKWFTALVTERGWAEAL
jgi:hypothetical protein